MKSEHNHPKRHRGSSPPFQEAEQGFHDWLSDLKSIGQNYDNTSESQVHKQQRYQKEESVDQKSNSQHIKNVRADQQSFDEVESQRDKDDEIRWRDDGGESG